MIKLSDINKIKNIIVEQVKPIKIILFGSYALGTANEESDLDLLVIQENNELPRIKRAFKLRKYLKEFKFPKDILIYTEKEVKDWENVELAFVTKAISSGKVLYEK